MSELAASQLPSGWSWESLADVAADGAPVLYGILQPGPDMPDGVPYVRPTEIVEDVIDLSSIRRTTQIIAGKYKRSMLKPDDIILSIVGTIGKVAVVPSDLDGGNITQSSVRLRPRPDVVAPRYVAWALRSPVLRQQFDKHRLGTAVPRLNVAHVRALRIPVAPLPEQRRIVAEIEKQFTRLDAGVAALRRVQANLKRYRAAVLKAACEGRLVPTEAELAKSGIRKGNFESGEALLDRILAERRKNWRGRGIYKEPVSSDTTDLPPIPHGWAWATADQFTTVITDGEHITPQRSDSGVLLLSARNVLDGRISFEIVDFVPQKEYDRIAKRLMIVPGDVLLSCSGSVGRSAVVPDGLVFTLVRSVAVLKPMAGMGKYLSIALRSPLLKQQILAKQTQTAQANIFQGKIKVLCIPLPPLSEQTRIVAEVERRLSVVEELEAVVAANLQRAARLRQSILQKAFTGELV